MSQLAVRLVSALVWRLPGHGARKLWRFAHAEAASRLDLLQAAQLAPSVERRAAYLRHSLDEARHARLFARRSSELRVARGQPPHGEPRVDTEELYERLGEIGFLAFVHRGERRGRRQFEVYRDHFRRRGDRRTQAIFRAILVDEQQHESYTRELLVELTGGEGAARAALRRAALWENWRRWRRAGRFLADRVFWLSMILIYLIAAPLLYAPLRLALPARSGWRPPDQGR